MNRAVYSELKSARRRKGLTQAELADLVGCRQSAVSMMERGRMSALSAERLEKIGSILGVDVSEGGADVSAPVLRFCGSCDCPSHLPYLAGGDPVLHPRFESEGRKYCRWCGDVLSDVCPDCGAVVKIGAFCGECGAAYVEPLVEGDVVEWQGRREAVSDKFRSLVGQDR